MSPRRYLTSGIRISVQFSRYNPDTRRYVRMGRTRRTSVTTERETERFVRFMESAVARWESEK